ncbi:cytochrome b/b6 domain-containing protein [Enterovibrio nigricans]|uniref:Cytochrome b n=1 Tax=Enterovibrio nigricans DSM 22720 TaxID=1121868 RepID=A0A1T4W1Z3_9GAMM|nr:cytochrome b/b6 domain-containing protein [Enterovibrio nigricans]PKF48925.1 hydrogenase [Enterovibrio nigricans]SKA70731.1 Cytochrome b [Enterovibrio nigricans DSM 22720]
MKIWDLPTRLYHWLQAALFTLLVISGFSGNGPHELFGIGLACLVVWRITWGIAGSDTSRFKQFICSPNTVIRYLQGEHSHHGVGHNPAGGWMVTMMLSLLIAQCFIGMSLAGFFDPILNDDSILYDIDLLVSLHIWLAYALVTSVVCHVAAIVIYKMKGKPLVKAMVTGKHASLIDSAGIIFRSNIRAVILLGIVGGAMRVLLNL